MWKKNKEQKTFLNRRDLHLYCNENDKILYDNTVFEIPNLPDYIQLQNNVDLYKESLSVLQKLEDSRKKICLCYSGGADSAFALESMCRNNFPPDMIVVYTADPFETPEPYNSFYLEHKPALDDVLFLKENNKMFKNTEIVHIHITHKYLEEFYSNIDWPLQNYGHGMGVDQALTWSSSTLPYINQYCNPEEYIFVQGGNTPDFVINDDQNINFFYVDLQFPGLIDNTSESIDFINYDKNFFNAYCSSIVQNRVNNLNPPTIFSRSTLSDSVDQNLTSKFLTPEFQNISRYSHFQISKKARESRNYSGNLLDDIHNMHLKDRILYLQCLKQRPKWFEYYIEAFEKHKEWFEEFHNSEGILSKMIPVIND